MSNTMDPDTWAKKDLFTKKYYRDVYPAIDPVQAELSQAGKISVITGAGRGIGPGIALAHAKAGAKSLVLVGRNSEHLKKTQCQISTDYPNVEVLIVSMDISDEESVKKLWSTVEDRFGAVDTLVNNAGVFTSPYDNISKVDPKVWWTDMEVNVKGTFLMTAGFLRTSEKSTARTLINIVATPDLVTAGVSSYFLSKATIVRFGQHVAVEEPDVVVYSLYPGLVKTDMLLDDFRHLAGDTAELAGAVSVWLAAKRPLYLNGRYLSVNWDVEEIEGRKEEINGSRFLMLGLP